MQTANFVEALQQDLRELAQIGGDDLVESARRLEGAVKQSATLRLIDLLTEAALELSEQLPSGHVDLRIAAQEPQLVYVEEAAAAAEPAPPPADDEQTRITLRLPDSLKTSIETAASRDGVSVNTWIVKALARGLSGAISGGSRGIGSRLTGYGQS